jgi:REP element-mobilizing transposase RayT
MAPRSGQLALALKPRFGWGGARPGAGRKRAGRGRVPHRARAPISSRHPVHVTLRLERGIESLRTKRAYRIVRRAMAEGRDRFGFRLVHYSVQRDHLHLIVETKDERALSRGIKGLQVRVARRLNTLLARTGRVFGDRYHARALETPREVRSGLAYVLLNARKHARQSGRPLRSERADPCSSAVYFDGWKRPIRCAVERRDPPPVEPPRTWLLRIGWRRRGLISPAEVPGARSHPRRDFGGERELSET